MRTAAAAALAAAAVFAGCGSSAPVDTTGADVAANLKTVAGVPQSGITLGSPSAPYTLTVFDSLDSFNRGFFLSDLPALVQQYVRGGRLKVQVQTLTDFDAGQSDDTGAADAARLAQAAGRQDHLWDFYGALSARYIGTIDQATLDAALHDVPGVDATQAETDAKGADVRRAIDAANTLASDDNVTDLPYYTLTKGSGTPAPVDGSCQGCLLRGVTRVLGGQAPAATPTATLAPVATRKDGRRVGFATGRQAKAPTGPSGPSGAAGRTG